MLGTTTFFRFVCSNMHRVSSLRDRCGPAFMAVFLPRLSQPYSHPADATQSGPDTPARSVGRVARLEHCTSSVKWQEWRRVAKATTRLVTLYTPKVKML